jgi:hypothetical protein
LLIGSNIDGRNQHDHFVDVAVETGEKPSPKKGSESAIAEKVGQSRKWDAE